MSNKIMYHFDFLLEKEKERKKKRDGIKTHTIIHEQKKLTHILNEFDIAIIIMHVSITSIYHQLGDSLNMNEKKTATMKQTNTTPKETTVYKRASEVNVISSAQSILCIDCLTYDAIRQ